MGKFTKFYEVTDSYKNAWFQHSSSDDDILHSPPKGEWNKWMHGVALGACAGKPALWKARKNPDCEPG